MKVLHIGSLIFDGSALPLLLFANVGMASHVCFQVVYEYTYIIKVCNILKYTITVLRMPEIVGPMNQHSLDGVMSFQNLKGWLFQELQTQSSPPSAENMQQKYLSEFP